MEFPISIDKKSIQWSISEAAKEHSTGSYSGVLIQ